MAAEGAVDRHGRHGGEPAGVVLADERSALCVAYHRHEEDEALRWQIPDCVLDFRQWNSAEHAITQPRRKALETAARVLAPAQIPLGNAVDDQDLPRVRLERQCQFQRAVVIVDDRDGSDAGRQPGAVGVPGLRAGRDHGNAGKQLLAVGQQKLQGGFRRRHDDIDAPT